MSSGLHETTTHGYSPSDTDENVFRLKLAIFHENETSFKCGAILRQTAHKHN